MLINREEMLWCRNQGWFDYSVESLVVFTKCGKRFDNMLDIRSWTEENDRVDRPGLYCRVCSTRMVIRGVCTIFYPNKKCGMNQ